MVDCEGIRAKPARLAVEHIQPIMAVIVMNLLADADVNNYARQAGFQA